MINQKEKPQAPRFSMRRFLSSGVCRAVELQDIAQAVERRFLMVGAGPEWTYTDRGNKFAAEFALDFMIWPWPDRKLGWFVEPTYSAPGDGHEADAIGDKFDTNRLNGASEIRRGSGCRDFADRMFQA